MIRLCRLTTNLLRLAPMKSLKGLQNAPLYGFFEGYKQRKYIMLDSHNFEDVLLSIKHKRTWFSSSVPITQPFDIFVSVSKQKNIKLSFPQSTDNGCILDDQNKAILNKTQLKGPENSSQFEMKDQYLPHQIYLPNFINEKVIHEVEKACQKIKNGRRIKVQAKLVSLNLHRSYGLQKNQFSNPKKRSIGILLVFLPSEYKGGDLIVSKNKQKYSFNFGNQSTINCVTLQSDSIYKFQRMIKGCRLILYYELFQEQNDFAIQPNPDLVKMISALKEKAVNGVENRTVLGYFCENYYGNEQMKNAKKIYTLLKGTDFDLFIAAKKCGAKSIRLKLFYPSEYEDIVKDGKNLPRYISKNNEIKEFICQNPVEKQRSKSKQQEQEQEQDQKDQQTRNQIEFISQPQEIAGKFYNYTFNFKKQKDRKIQIWQDFDDIQWLNRLNRKSQYRYGVVQMGNQVQFKYCYLIMLINL